MDVFLIRHAVAAPGKDDDARPLTKEGAVRFTQQVALLKALGVRFQRLLHSPKKRAVQTAELLDGLVDGDCEVTALLARPVTPALLDLMVGDSVGLVGHEPHLSALLALLVTGRTDGGQFELKKGAVAHLEGHPRPGEMRLTWLLPVKIARVTR